MELLNAMPAPKCMYLLEPIEGSAGPLEPDAKLQKLNDKWFDVFQPFTDDQEGIDWHRSLLWLSWLEKNPQAWQSFEVVGELFLALEEGVQPFHGFSENILYPLMKRGFDLLSLIVKQHHAENLRLEWGWMENRNALRLIDALSQFFEAHDNLKDAIQLMEWLVNTLNPNDNQGKREALLHHYLRQGRVDDAIKLAEYYPRDMAPVQYGHVLALVMASREKEAVTILTQAKNDYPEVYKMLISPKPRRPALQEGMVTVGGKDEAWFYREDYLYLWQSSGGLDWLKKQGKVKPFA